MGDVVDSRAGARDRDEFFAGDELVHFRGAHERDLGLVEIARALVPVVEAVKPAFGYRVEACVCILHFVLPSSLEFIVESSRHA